ncbi:hypothetical protein SeLEV6574_g06740 [Synchytrium endobioticum]|nr:hypothetical protein SeLEV6574_g06740 [Synchytrium endobioticum]
MAAATIQCGLADSILILHELKSAILCRLSSTSSIRTSQLPQPSSSPQTDAETIPTSISPPPDHDHISISPNAHYSDSTAHAESTTTAYTITSWTSPFLGQHHPLRFNKSSIFLHTHTLHSHPRRFWSQRKLDKLEAEADDPAFRTDTTRQADLYKELLKTGNYAALIHRYETQPQLGPTTLRYPQSARALDAQFVQQDRDCLKAYITALAREGRIDTLSDRLSHLMGRPNLANSCLSQPSSDSSNNTNIITDIEPSSSNSMSTSKVLLHGRQHLVKTSTTDWERAVAARSAPGRSPLNRFLGISATSAAGANEQTSGDREAPIQVIISEAWSWGKFARTMTSKILLGLLLMTGLSVVLDQQGIIKSGMASAEVEPNHMSQPIKFADVQGVDEAKAELEEIVSFLREPKKFMEVGGKLPKGILLYGPPGTGKTHLARAVAGEAGVPFFQMSGSEFDELYVGVGARRVRELFTAAKKKAPCIVFIDEIDAVGSKRSSKDQSYMRQTLNQLLVELDGFSSSEGVIFIAATNTPEALDKALIRPGRFDRLVPVPLPDVKGRSRILEVHMRAVQVARDVDTTTIARGTPGFSGADLANLINQAAIKASKDGAKSIRMHDLEWAKDKIIMGSERKSAVISEHNRRLTAYHEGGHTLVALYTPGSLPLHKVTVIPRGNALGVTVQLPEADATNHTRKELSAILDVCMGGRAAEEIIFGVDEVTTGAHSDLEKATSVAREMVMHYGMSEKVGLGAYRDEELEKLSPQTRVLIESEVKSMLSVSYARATSILKTHKDELHRLSRALMDYETLTLEEVKAVIKGVDINKAKRIETFVASASSTITSISSINIKPADGTRSPEGRVAPALVNTGSHSDVVVPFEDIDEVDECADDEKDPGKGHSMSKAIPVPTSSRPARKSMVQVKHDEGDALSHELSTSVELEVLAFQCASSLSGVDIASGGQRGESGSDNELPPPATKVGLADFELLSVIGQGAYGKVYLVRLRDTGRVFAMKVLKKASIVVHSKMHEHTQNERTILEEVQHCPFIVNLHYAFQTADKLYLVLQYACGGELFTHLGIEGMFSEEQASFYIAELVLALDHLHQLGIIYRDLKPENCLLDAEGHILLTDFGLSKTSLEAKTICGTVEFMPPEIILEQSYDKSVDFWALGIMTFNLLTGAGPFRSSNPKKLNERIIKAKFECPKYMSSYAKDFCIRLLKKSPAARLGAGRNGIEDIKKHGFFRKIDWKALTNKEVAPPIVPKVESLLDVKNFHQGSVKGLEDAFKGFSYVNRFLAADVKPDESLGSFS